VSWHLKDQSRVQCRWRRSKAAVYELLMRWFASGARPAAIGMTKDDAFAGGSDVRRDPSIICGSLCPKYLPECRHCR